MNKEADWLLRDKYKGILEPQFEADFNNDLLRLQNGEPLAYVIGWVPFLGAKIYLDSLPLIPRAETEYWVANAIDQINKQIKEYVKKYSKENIKVLDLCAGSGCIGVAVLKNVMGAQVDFVEIDITHHETILKNINENSIDINRAKIFGGNLFQNVIGTYDFILTNPPYINPQYINDVQDGVLKNEPHLALFGGSDGMQIVREILQKAPQFLTKNLDSNSNLGGVLYIEHEPHQATEIQTVLPGIEPLPDQFGVIRYSVFRK